MKNHSNIDVIISKFLDDQATEDEKTFLIEWIKDSENRAYLEGYLKTEVWVKYSFNSSVIEKQLSVLSIVTKPKRKKAYSSFLKYAAIFIGILASTAFVYLFKGQSGNYVLENSILTLEINDGASRFLSLENQENFTYDNNSIFLKDNGSLQYGTGKESRIPEYHTIHVPNGKTFQVQLADGSQVYMNSGSKLTYPNAFNGFKSRQVSLVGEAYFKVAKSNVPFIVNADGLSTKVLGTEFNVSAYKNETFEEVTLVEGSVEVFDNNPKDTHTSSRIIVPNQRAIKEKAGNDLAVDEVDVKNRIAWIDGIIVFEKENINIILRKLERRFNISIKNNYEKLDELRYSGRFKDENIDDILKTMQAHTSFSYSMEGNTLTIDNP
ncbi:FecR family protein [Maribacter sp. 4G9]|uniref:FecR family protein n=1 Tax=Maribacter sp. 4G9 TaxID=1889777 RepID=UPI000C148187|nr:FecR domain-containing protein [Maribacter sp. 4G9]PIB38447.1 hypothetical protein BFP75_16200 [Maribacter sp. 4G9]